MYIVFNYSKIFGNFSSLFADGVLSQESSEVTLHLSSSPSCATDVHKTKN